MESKFANRVETFNEIMTIFTLYCLQCFTDFVPNPEDRDANGIAFIAILGIYAAVHFYFLFGDLLGKLKQVIKKRLY